jgi:hypothetical protein
MICALVLTCELGALLDGRHHRLINLVPAGGVKGPGVIRRGAVRLLLLPRLGWLWRLLLLCGLSFLLASRLEFSARHSLYLWERPARRRILMRSLKPLALNRSAFTTAWLKPDMVLISIFFSGAVHLPLDQAAILGACW